MDDLISRQAAKDAVASMKTVAHSPYGTINRLDALLRLSRLPSAERRGRWIVLGEQIENQTFDECKCSECGCVEYFNKGWKRFNYCPNCGARLEADE